MGWAELVLSGERRRRRQHHHHPPHGRGGVAVVAAVAAQRWECTRKGIGAAHTRINCHHLPVVRRSPLGCPTSTATSKGKMYTHSASRPSQSSTHSPRPTVTPKLGKPFMNSTITCIKSHLKSNFASPALLQKD